MNNDSDASIFGVRVGIRYRNMLTNEVSTKNVIGTEAGPFVVHRRIEAHTLPAYTVTHRRTGYAVCRASRRGFAIRAAQQLSKVADWEFDDPGVPTTWPRELLDLVHHIRGGRQA